MSHILITRFKYFNTRKNEEKTIKDKLHNYQGKTLGLTTNTENNPMKRLFHTIIKEVVYYMYVPAETNFTQKFIKLDRANSDTFRPTLSAAYMKNLPYPEKLVQKVF